MVYCLPCLVSLCMGFAFCERMDFCILPKSSCWMRLMWHRVNPGQDTKCTYSTALDDFRVNICIERAQRLPQLPPCLHSFHIHLSRQEAPIAHIHPPTLLCKVVCAQRTTIWYITVHWHLAATLLFWNTLRKAYRNHL